MEFSFPYAQIAGLCKKYGPGVIVPAGIDGATLMWAIAGKESSYGADCRPRHEQAYCYGGVFYEENPTKEWGCLWHCSFGPWQMMASNFPRGFTVDRMMSDPDFCASSAALFLTFKIKQRDCRSLDEIAMTWNEGDFSPVRLATDAYTQAVLQAYAHPLVGMSA